MTTIQTAAQVLAGWMIGILAAWGLMVAYAEYGAERGSLIVPLSIVLAAAAVLARRLPHHRSTAIGLALGAAMETAFFLYLFTTL